MMQSFFDTYNCMRSFTNYIKPLSYDEWHDLPEDHKAAVLFVQYWQVVILHLPLYSNLNCFCSGHTAMTYNLLAVTDTMFYS